MTTLLEPDVAGSSSASSPMWKLFDTASTLSTLKVAAARSATSAGAAAASSTASTETNRNQKKKKNNNNSNKRKRKQYLGQGMTSSMSSASGASFEDDEAFVRGVFAEASNAEVGGVSSNPSSTISSPTLGYPQLLDFAQQHSLMSLAIPSSITTPSSSPSPISPSSAPAAAATTTSSSLLMPWFKDVVQPPRDIDPHSIRCRRKNRRRVQVGNGETATGAKGKNGSSQDETTMSGGGDANPGERKGRHGTKRALGGSGGRGGRRGAESSATEDGRVDQYNYCGYFTLKKDSSSRIPESDEDKDSAASDVDKDKSNEDSTDAVDKIRPALRSLRRHIIDGNRRPPQPSAGDSRSAINVVQPEGHIASLNECMHMLDLFKSYLAFFVPLCPAAMHPANVRRVLFPQPGEEAAGSALSLNVYTALSLASILVRDLSKAEKFYYHARMHLQYLFDTPDYSVAEALIGLRYYCINAGHADKVAYYNTLAKNMCRQLNAYNSAAYTRCVLFDLLYPGTTPAEKKLVLHDYLTRSKSSPYFDYQPGLYSENEATLRRLLAFGQRITISIVITFATMSPPGAKDNCDGAEANKSAERLEAEARLLDIMLQKLAVWEKLIVEQVHGLNPKAAEGAQLCVFGYRAECNWRLGRQSDALHWAKRFADLLQTTDSGYTLHAVRQAMATVLNILSTMEQDDTLEQLLQLIGPLRMYKYWSAVHDHFMATLEHKRMNGTEGSSSIASQNLTSMMMMMNENDVSSQEDSGSSSMVTNSNINSKELTLQNDVLKSIMQTILDADTSSSSSSSDGELTSSMATTITNSSDAREWN